MRHTDFLYSRRDALAVGLGALTAAILANPRRAPAAPDASRPRLTQGKAKSVIQIWLWGGPCHIDTFAPTPDAGYDYCGPLKSPIATNVDCIRIGELLPLLAKQADKYSLIRSMTHSNNGHESAAY